MKHLPLKKAYEFGTRHGVGSEVEKIKSPGQRWKTYTSSVRRGLIAEFFQDRGIFDEFKDAYGMLAKLPPGAKEPSITSG